MTLTEAKEVMQRAVDHPDELVMPSVLREAGAVLLVELQSREYVSRGYTYLYQMRE